MKALSMPYPYFVDLDGNPLDNGEIYIGAENTNPVTSNNQLQVWADIDGTIPLSQPIATSFGYPSRYGKPINIFVDSVYSLVVRSSAGEVIVNEPSSAVLTPSSGTSNAEDDFGAVGDGTTDDSQPLNSILDGSVTGKVFIPAGVYNIESLLVIDCQDLEICGIEGATIITTSSLQSVAQIVRMENVQFSGITFRVTSTSGSDSDGVVFGDSPLISNSSFTRCGFTAPDCKASAFVLSGTDSPISRFRFEHNNIYDVGSKGVYIEAGTYSDVRVCNNTIKNTGLYDDIGDGITMYGIGSDAIWVSNNRLNNVCRHAIFIEQVSNAVIENNKFSQISRDCNLLYSPDSASIKRNNIVSGNSISDRISGAAGGVALDGWTDCRFSNNQWIMIDRFSMEDCVHCKFSNDTIDTTAANAVYISGDSNNNEWLGGIVTNAEAVDAATNETILTNGANVEDNIFIGVEIYKTASGEILDAENGADEAILLNCSGDLTQETDGSIEDFAPFPYFLTNTDVAYTSTGKLVKNGAHVYGEFEIIFTNKGSGPGGQQLNIGGFPYQLADDDLGSAVAITSAFLGFGSGQTITAEFFSAGDPANCYVVRSNGSGTTSVLRSDLTDTSRIRFSFNYITSD